MRSYRVESYSHVAEAQKDSCNSGKVTLYVTPSYKDLLEMKEVAWTFRARLVVESTISKKINHEKDSYTDSVP